MKVILKLKNKQSPNPPTSILYPQKDMDWTELNPGSDNIVL